MRDRGNVGERAAGEKWVGSVLALARRHALLLCILAVGLLVRLWGIDFGLPYEGLTYGQLTYEESKEVHRAFKLGVGEYVWQFSKGGMYLILFVEFGFYYVLSLAMGWVHDSKDFALSVLQDRTTAYLIGRVTNALMGTLTVLVIYALGRKLYDRRTGLVAACLGALAYFHAQFSTVINVDVGMALALWGSVLLYAIYEERGTVRWLVATGAASAAAIAFKLPGGIVVPLILGAITTTPGMHRRPGETVKGFAIYCVSLAVVLTVIAPEWLLWAAEIVQEIAPSAQAATTAAADDAASLDEEIFALSNVRHGISFRYLEHLVSSYNVVLTVMAAAAFALGLWRKKRWEILLGAMVVVFIVGMSSSGWTQPERYLMPIVPALWLLGARFIVEMARGRRALLVAGLAAVLAVPVWTLARAASEKSGDDTRVLAKAWIEQHVPAGSRLLIDAMQYRNIIGPPLNPDEKTLRNQVARVESRVEEGQEIGRGVNKRTLALYEEAQRRIPGPRYELHSTVHGLAVESPDYYVENCFDYVVTSSIVTNRYLPGGVQSEQHPQSARFYDQLPRDRRYEEVHREVAVPWHSSGPTITVYKVRHPCAGPGASRSAG